jgi:hypothetical protein
MTRSPCLLGIAAALLAVAATACGEQYCQRGAAGPTRCYTINEMEYQETLSRPEPPPERATQPSPGCYLIGPNSFVPQGNGGSRPATPPYLMSGACVSRRQPAHGAVR